MNNMKKYDECYFLNYDRSNDLELYEVGKHACPALYSYGPIIRSRSIFHYVLSGKGVLKINKEKYEICAHQGFFIPSGIQAYYKADADEPWDYIWIHIDGPMVHDYFQQAGITSEQPLFIPTSCENGVSEIMFELLAKHDKELYCIGKIYELFDIIINISETKCSRDSDTQLEYVRKIINYIQIKYSEHIQVSNIASACGLERSYITKLFKKATGYTIQEYLIYFRIKKACQMLEKEDISIQHIAFAIGYSDSFTFSKAFKRIKGMSPSEYRERHKVTKIS